MKRNRPRKVPRRGSSLADALSSSVRGDPYRLRNTLRQQARDAIARQLAETSPPWRRRSKPRRRARSVSRVDRHTPNAGDVRQPGPPDNLPPRVTPRKPGHDVPVFLAGGGAANRLHQDVVGSLDVWLKRDVRNDGIRRLDLPAPPAIDLPEPLAGFGRMAVAWGLSYPPTEIGRIDAMRDIEDIGAREVIDGSDRFVSKDHV